jgi:hypothetical protein
MPPSGTTKEASGGGPHDGRSSHGYEQSQPEGDPPDTQAQPVEAEHLPTFPGVALPGDHKQHNQCRHGRGARPQDPHAQVRGEFEKPDRQGHSGGHHQYEHREDCRLARVA